MRQLARDSTIPKMYSYARPLSANVITYKLPNPDHTRFFSLIVNYTLYSCIRYTEYIFPISIHFTNLSNLLPSGPTVNATASPYDALGFPLISNTPA